jgi:exosortase C (VPDSG-CTERM-specific)
VENPDKPEVITVPVNLRGEERTSGAERLPERSASSRHGEADAGQRWREIAGLASAAVLLLAFGPMLVDLARHALASELHSHVILIPFISAYLLWIRQDELPRHRAASPIAAAGAAACAVIALVAAKGWVFGSAFTPRNENDYLATMTVSFLCFAISLGFLFLGRRWMAAAAFPIFFLIFMVPMPAAAEAALETASKLGSAEVTHLLFNVVGTPYLRDGLIFQLPGITIEVAQECSGIRSSWVLLITSLLASNLFLRTTWRRALLVLFVLPLGLLRNGLRILVIAILCVEISPEMIHSILHRRGGPIFFALSLLPLFGLLWWLRASERRGEQQPAISSAPPKGVVEQ